MSRIRRVLPSGTFQQPAGTFLGFGSLADGPPPRAGGPPGEGSAANFGPQEGSSRDNMVDEQLNEIINVVDDRIEFGDPQHPQEPENNLKVAAFAILGLQGEFLHNGTRSNIYGSWGEWPIPILGPTEINFTHNLYLDTPEYVLPVTGRPNVRFLHFGTFHNGAGSGPSTLLQVDIHWLGGTVTANSIRLFIHARLQAGLLTVNSANRILITLFFTQATRTPFV